MKLILPIVLGIVSIALAVSLYMTKQSDATQHEADANAITDFSNQLIVAQSQITLRGETILTLSNNLCDCQSASISFSNHSDEANLAVAQGRVQITNLSLKISELQAGNRALERRATELTNQITNASNELAAMKSSLAETNQSLLKANKDYLALENRFRIDVAERTVIQRKFNNIAELKAQIKKLQALPFGETYPDVIYAGLGVEVKSNGAVHVFEP